MPITIDLNLLLASKQTLEGLFATFNNVNLLENFNKLKSVRAWGSKITDVSPFANLVNLNYLDLAGNKFKDLTPLSKLPNLITLDLSRTAVEDLTPILPLIEIGLPVIYANYSSLSDQISSGIFIV
ncbi:MAG: leucine-rich repeat domain-containing protein [Saprospiraceae bacterium]|nr:leucine-rich repeat domain-containing protein [Saprospiraceae bacterium]